MMAKVYLSSIPIMACAALLALAGIAHAETDDKTTKSTVVLAGGKDTCLTNPPSKTTETALAIVGPLVASLAGKAADIGYDALSNYVSQSIKDDSTFVSVTLRSGFFYRLQKAASGEWVAEPALDCIVVARGRLGAPDTAGLKAFAQNVDPKGRFTKVGEDKSISFPVLQRLGLAEFPDLYLELALERDALSSVFRIQPRAVYLRQTSLKAPPPDGKVDLNLTLSFSQAGASSPSAILPLHIPNVKTGSDLPVANLSLDNPWAVMITHPDPKTLHIPDNIPFSQIPVSPINITAALEETATPSRYLVFLNNLMNKARPDVSSAVSELLKQQVGGLTGDGK